ncbi:hypothetical protein JOD24_001082 [Kroppenstedtia sanguinis]
MLPKRDLGAEATLARLVPYGCKATFVPQALQSKGAEALD